MAAHDLAERPGLPARDEAHGERALSARYRSLFVLGRGGMGTVEAALEIERPSSKSKDERSTYRRVVALKRLLPEGAQDARKTEMFLREARLATMLDHPNVVRAYDYGEVEGELFLSMEYVEGQPLSRLLRTLASERGELDCQLAAYVLAEVCRGLHAAHELADPSTGTPLHVVHRDVSPQNVMIGYDGTVKLLDFGVAKIEAEYLTKTGEVKGKTAYMSPEQAMGDPLDRRSDLFGVGAVLFECLTLRRMWGEGTEMDVLRKLALDRPPALEGAEAVRGIYSRLVARKAEERYASAADVADALGQVAGEGEAARARLRGLLARYFGEIAKELRGRLSAAIEEVAPERAEALRESVLPPRGLPSTTTSTSTRGGGRLALIAAVIGVAGLAWWVGAHRTTEAPIREAPSSQSVEAPSAIVAATATVTTSAAPYATATASASAGPSATTPLPSSHAAPKPRPTASATSATMPSSRPSAAPALPDIDEKPF